MFQSFLAKAKDAVQDATAKVKQQASGMAKMLKTETVVGSKSYIVQPDQYILPMPKGGDHVFSMKCPVEKSDVTYSGQAEIGAISTYLNSQFGDRYLIINVSDVPYDYGIFHGKVQEFFFPGYPAPPIKVLVQMCVTVQSWLKHQKGTNKANSLRHSGGGGASVESSKTSRQPDPYAVLFHCKTGKGRSAVVVAAFLAWISAFPSPMEALDSVCEALKMPVEMVTIPSQRRYIEYFTRILDGAKPAARTLILSRVIVHSVPQFGVASPGTPARPGLPGCHPELRVVKNGKVVYRGEHAATEKSKVGRNRGAVRAGDGGIKFQVRHILRCASW